MLRNIKTFSVDTCSLLLLHRSDTLELAMQHYQLFSPSQVIIELKEKSFHGIHEKLLERIHTVDVKITNPINKTCLSLADKAVISLYLSANCDAVLSDDKKILLYCKDNNIPHFSCVSIYALMQYQNILDNKTAETLILNMGKIGRYSEKIIKMALDLQNKWPAKKTGHI